MELIMIMYQRLIFIWSSSVCLIDVAIIYLSSQPKKKKKTRRENKIEFQIDEIGLLNLIDKTQKGKSLSNTNPQKLDLIFMNGSDGHYHPLKGTLMFGLVQLLLLLDIVEHGRVCIKFKLDRANRIFLLNSVTLESISIPRQSHYFVSHRS